jgi:membrane protein YdbS with pleckstrin-like domain
MATYPSKRDWWLLALLWLCLGLMVVGFVSAFTEPVAPWMRVFAAAFFAAFAALMVWLLILPYRTDYTLDSESLVIHVGPFKHTIPLAEIYEVFPTHNPLSAPAWSLDRVRIRFTSSRFGALISPERQDQFFLELEALAPQLIRQGDRLVLEDDSGRESQTME